jgi:hypothetical protein
MNSGRTNGYFERRFTRLDVTGTGFQAFYRSSVPSNYRFIGRTVWIFRACFLNGHPFEHWCSLNDLKNNSYVVRKRYKLTANYLILFTRFLKEIYINYVGGRGKAKA